MYIFSKREENNQSFNKCLRNQKCSKSGQQSSIKLKEIRTSLSYFCFIFLIKQKAQLKLYFEEKIYKINYKYPQTHIGNL